MYKSRFILQLNYKCIFMMRFRFCFYLLKVLSPNTQPPLISTLVLQNDLLACTNTSNLPNTQIQWQHGVLRQIHVYDEKTLLFRP